MTMPTRSCRILLIPVAFTTTLFLDAFGVSVNVAVFGKVARETVFGEGSTISQGAVVAVVAFVGPGH